MYILYHNNYFNKFFKDKTEVKETVKQNTETKEGEKKPSLEELASSYGYLLDIVNINNHTDYLNDYYSGNLTSELENYLALNTINLNNLTVEDDYNIIEEDKIKTAYTNIFSQEHKYSSKTFKYNGYNLRYISKLGSYISSEIIVPSSSEIVRQIISVEQVNDQIKITTVEAIVRDGLIYNILSNENIGVYEEGKLNNYEEVLNKITYTFDKDKKLISITK